MRPVPENAVSFVKAHEGCVLTAYKDSGGVWTVGYGHTAQTVLGQKMTQDRAEALLREDLATAATRLAGVVNAPIITELTDNQYAALLSFVFNLGADSSWTIWKLLNAGKFDQVPAQLNRFVNAGGNKVQGLVNRRAAEVVLWSTEEPGSVPDAPSSAVTRAAETPPTTTAAKPLAKQASFVTKVGGVATAGAAACTTYAPQVKSWADQLASFTGAPIIAHAQTALLTVAGGLLMASIVFSMLKQRAAKT